MKYKVSYWLSLLFSQLLIIELVRAYIVVKKRVPRKKVNEDKLINFEFKQMHDFWTERLDDKEVERGNSYLIWERARWVVFQALIVGL